MSPLRRAISASRRLLRSPPKSRPGFRIAAVADEHLAAHFGGRPVYANCRSRIGFMVVSPRKRHFRGLEGNLPPTLRKNLKAAILLSGDLKELFHSRLWGCLARTTFVADQLRHSAVRSDPRCCAWRECLRKHEPQSGFLFRKRFRRWSEFEPLESAVPPPESAVGRGTSSRPSDRAHDRVGERQLPPLSAPRKVAIRHIAPRKIQKERKQ